MTAKYTQEQRTSTFWAKVNKTETCWLWLATTSNGYGQVQWDGRSRPAHRVAYELLIGPIPAGLQLDHLCRVPGCVNPSHLEPVSGRENTLRGVGFAARNATKSQCPRGHAYSDNNIHPRADGWRECRQCLALRYQCPICLDEQTWHNRGRHFQRHHPGVDMNGLGLKPTPDHTPRAGRSS